jgi:DNA-binding beta-propeller fold protein YncE
MPGSGWRRTLPPTPPMPPPASPARPGLFRRRFARWPAPALGFAVLAASAAAAPGAFRLLARYPVGGAGGYDYARVDPPARRLYVAHDTRVDVLDADTGRQVGEIGPTVHAHGIALAPEAGHGFITNGDDNTVTMFDPGTLAVLRTIPMPGRNPDAIEYDPDTRHVFVADGASGDLAVLDADSGAVVADLPLGGHLEAMAGNGYGHLWICVEDRSVLHVVDTRALKSQGDIPLAPGEGPTGIALDPTGRRLWVACGNRQLVSVDGDNGMVIAEFPIGEHPDGAAFDPVGRRVFVSCRDGTLTIVRYKSNVAFAVDQTLTTAYGARTIALDPMTHRVFLPTGKFGTPPGPVPLPGTLEVLVVGPAPTSSP